MYVQVHKHICVVILEDQLEVSSIDCEIQPAKGINAFFVFFCFENLSIVITSGGGFSNMYLS